MRNHYRDTRWFLVQIKPNCCKIADNNLKRQGFQTFLPLVKVTKQRNGKFINSFQPLFPGYIFVAFDISQGFWYKINSTYGVTQLVTFGKKPIAVPRNIMSQLILQYTAKNRLLPSKPLKPREQITIIRGPFANFVAEVEKTEACKRVWVLMEIMGGQIRVGVDADKLLSIKG